MRLAGLLLALLLVACAAPPRPDGVRPDLDPRWLTAEGKLRWPPDNGFARPAVPMALPVGLLLDRFGDDKGRFLSPKGAAFRARALPGVCAAQTYSVFRVATPILVWVERAVPWFDEPGGATQVQTDVPVQRLLDDGALVRVPGAAAPC